MPFRATHFNIKPVIRRQRPEGISSTPSSIGVGYFIELGAALNICFSLGPCCEEPGLRGCTCAIQLVTIVELMILCLFGNSRSLSEHQGPWALMFGARHGK